MRLGNEALKVEERRRRGGPPRPSTPERANGAQAPVPEVAGARAVATDAGDRDGPQSRAVPRGQPRRERVEDVLIRAFNIVVAAVALVLLLPLMVLIAIAIKLDSPGPVFYKQLRIGIDRRSRRRAEIDTGRRTADLGGRPFLMYKFRTMRHDAEHDTGPVWASGDDARTTRLGRWLREYRFDELPQFLNVLKGDMSVVGPRPERPSFVGRLRDEIDGYTLRQRVPPGITGWAQVNRDADRTVEDVREKLRYDLEYLYQRSLWFDLRIMMRTLPVMLERERLTEGP